MQRNNYTYDIDSIGTIRSDNCKRAATFKGIPVDCNMRRYKFQNYESNVLVFAS